jgi:hypothetical protein
VGPGPCVVRPSADQTSIGREPVWVVSRIDAPLRPRTAVAVDAGTGRQLGEIAIDADEAGQRRLGAFADRFAAGDRNAR